MKFMLMMNMPSSDWAPGKWTPEDLDRSIAYMETLNLRLQADGEFVQAEGLAPPAEAHIVRASASGLVVTDGPWAESKEFLAGFWIISVETAERAHAIAAAISEAPGHGGAPLNMPIEVRQVMSVPPTK